MALIQLVVALIILSVIYYRMIQREELSISISQAIIPILLGIISTVLSFVFYLGNISLLIKIGFNSTSLPMWIRSFISAFIQAGLPEEIAKLLLILVAVSLYKSNIKNVYEYILIGAAIGFGFTLSEEFLYGSNNYLISIGRLITVAGHMSFGIIMAKHLGYAKYNKKIGSKAVTIEYIKAILIPIMIHTLYDACVADNMLMSSDNDVIELIGIVISIASIVAFLILQIKVLKELKDNTNKYCDMNLS